ncbi:MAG: RluA family pseudouridine synthase [Elusimicrobiota bacterium]
MTPEFVEVPFQVQRPQDGLRVDAYLAERLHRYSRSEVQRIIGQGRVFLRGRAAKAASRVADGDVVLIRYPKRDEEPCAHQALRVLYEDESLLAVDKPGGVLSHPTDKIVENSVTTILKRQFPALKLHLIHRLDKDTSGILLLAKDPAAARAVADQFTRRTTRKRYLAVVAGRVSWKRKLVALAIGSEGGEIMVRQAAGTGAPALTEFECLSASEHGSLVRARPKTGRLHQIRVHLAHLGHPILGDRLYTGDGALYLKSVEHTITEEDILSLGAARQLLHAERLTLRHPVTGKALDLRAPIPGDLQAAMDRLGLAP